MSADTSHANIGLTAQEARTLLGWLAVVEGEGIQDENDEELGGRLRSFVASFRAPSTERRATEREAVEATTSADA